MENVLTGMGESATKNVKFVCSAGKGLDWFTTTGWAQLYSIVQHDSNSILSKKTAVIFNFGVNDLSNLQIMRSIITGLHHSLKAKDVNCTSCL